VGFDWFETKRHQRQHRVIDLFDLPAKGALGLKASRPRRRQFVFSSTTMRSAFSCRHRKFATAT